MNKAKNKKRKINKANKGREEIKTGRLQGQRKSKKKRNTRTRKWSRKSKKKRKGKHWRKAGV